ncbi:putative ABC transporter permease [Candidatus Saccharibacteria bacterium]|nr:putative ABC transporter permease [Candidatus Saccharibacteria bacterium]
MKRLDGQRSETRGSKRGVTRGVKAASATSGEAASSKSGKRGKSNKTRVFAKGLGFEKLFILFIIGCLFGYFYEVILIFGVHLMQDGTIFIERRSGVIYGPFSVIYGAGAVLMAAVLAERKYKWWQLFLYGGLLCCVCEYLLGWLQEVFTGTMSWDYSDHFLNINGRTSPLVFVIWGLVSMWYVGLVYPWVSRLVEKIPVKYGEIFIKVMFVFLVIDMALSFSAVVRMGMRHHGVPAQTPYGQFLDTVYNDERMKKAYPNTEFVEDYKK